MQLLMERGRVVGEGFAYFRWRFGVDVGYCQCYVCNLSRFNLWANMQAEGKPASRSEP